MTAILYVIPGSHPCAAVAKALALKGIPYERVDLIPLLARLQQKRRFGVAAVPGVVFADGERVAGSRAIVRAAEARVPEPALVPVEREARALVERAEEWGDQVLQAVTRRIVWAALRRAPAALTSYAEDADVPVPDALARLTAPLTARLAQQANGAGDPAVRADLVGLPTHLARIDGWIADGTLGGAAPNAADLQIGASLRLLLTLGDVRPLLEDRPGGALARALFPHYPGSVPAGALPAAWLPSPAAAAVRSPAPSRPV